MNTKALSTRRIFFGHASAALSAPLAVAATLAAEGQDAEDVAARLGALEDANAIRALQQAYVRLVNAGAHEDVAALFADPAAALVDTSVRILSADSFGEHDVIDVAPADGTATARLHCTVETESPIEPCCTLVQMARLQGEGVVKRSERRVLESAYVKRHGAWKLARAAFRPA
jgi:hypothetical protein